MNKEIGTQGEAAPHPFEGKCEEASIFSTNFYIPCGEPSRRAVYHKRDGATYRMCNSCADHNIRNRGGKEVFEAEQPQ